MRWEWGHRKWRFSIHSVTVFRTFYIHGHTTAFRWYNYQWPWAYFKVIGLFHIKFLKDGVWYGKIYYRQLIGNLRVIGLHLSKLEMCIQVSTIIKIPTSFRLVPLLMTLKYIWRSFSLGCHFHVHFSNPWQAFASHGLPAIAELLVVNNDALILAYFGAKKLGLQILTINFVVNY